MSGFFYLLLKNDLYVFLHVIDAVYALQLFSKVEKQLVQIPESMGKWRSQHCKAKSSQSLALENKEQVCNLMVKMLVMMPVSRISMPESESLLQFPISASWQSRP